MATCRANTAHRQKSPTATFLSRWICAMSEGNSSRDDRKRPMYQSQSQSTPGEAAAKIAAPGDLLSAYKRTPAFDELLGEDGQAYPHYAKLVGALKEFNPAELRR